MEGTGRKVEGRGRKEEVRGWIREGKGERRWEGVKEEGRKEGGVEVGEER